MFRRTSGVGETSSHSDRRLTLLSVRLTVYLPSTLPEMSEAAVPVARLARPSHKRISYMILDVLGIHLPHAQWHSRRLDVEVQTA